MKLKIAAKIVDASIIQELLTPWDVEYTSQNDADVTIFYSQEPTAEEHSVIIPSTSECFKNWAKRTRLEFDTKIGSSILVPATTSVSLTVNPENAFSFGSCGWRSSCESSSSYVEAQEDMTVLRMDVVKELIRILDATLEPAESKFHKIVTRVPIPYGLAPKRLRDFFMNSEVGPDELTLIDKLPVDALRFALVNAIEKASSKVLEKKPIFSENHLCVLTHDVETASGLQRARVFKKIEDKYAASSAWYIPSKRYKLEEESIKELAFNGEVGVHDTKHDGKLAHLSRAKLVKRVSEAKNSIETIVEHKVEGFRAPVLQHNPTILQALKEAGYRYDTSIPTWEPKHPFTMKSHGIGTVYPMTINGITEIPLTLPQDHQLLYVLNLSPKEVMKTWVAMANAIRELEGVCMFLVHPDYKFGDPYTSSYEELVNSITNDQKANVTLPSKLCGLISE